MIDKCWMYRKSSNTSRASNTGWGSKHIVLIEAGPQLEAGFRGIELLRDQRPLPAALDGGIVDKVESGLGMSVDDLGCIEVDDLGCIEEDEENEPFIDDDDDNVDDKDFEKKTES